jgi:hypothetical protein
LRKLALLVALGLLVIAGCGGSGSAAGTCEDVTSYDYDWGNDMLCTRSDGSTFYTDYAGAERFEKNGDE